MAHDLGSRNAFVAQIVDALAKGEYERVIKMAPTSKVNAAELHAAVKEYGRSVLPLLEHEWNRIEYMEITGSRPQSWFAVVPVFTVEEGLSDLSLELTLTAAESGQYAAEINGLHVL
jgi:hypothetical protein